ncbi:putative holin [Bordetella sp. 02P26C-1]|uniref:putative holin n=1 Tax=Bordetella sp. 02P26C-1 TaxID=2683195 RepID=UPI001352A6E1|nr:putative holin [Bordetella sp. 02P26C-1]MVW80164.1 hypothetical protein [Bordetella sp. 02P26C-1]
MTEPSSVAASVATYSGVAIAAAMPGVNGDALIGAFAGAVVFAIHAKDLSIGKRVAYLIVSILVGYLAEDEVTRWTHIQNSALAAFVASAFVVTAALSGIDWLRKLDITSFIKR